MKVTLTYTQSLDGRIATKTGKSRYISDAASLKRNQQLRKESQAILIGIGTVLKDDPLLTCRIEAGADPLRVILDPRLELPLSSQLAATAKGVPTLVLHCQKHPPVVEDFLHKGLETVYIPSDDRGRIPLKEVLITLQERGIDSVMVEGGSRILTDFFKTRLWTHLEVVVAGKIIGEGIPSIGDLGIQNIDELIEPELEGIQIMDREVLWRFRNPQTSLPSRTKALSSSPKPSPRMLFFTAPGEVALREVSPPPKEREKGVYDSLLMAISPGTERHIYQGHFNKGASGDPEIDFNLPSFTYPFAYGYINVVQDTKGKRFFGFLPHGERFWEDRDSLIPLPEGMSPEKALFIPHMETALSLVHDSNIQIGDRVLLTGSGVVGTLTARIIRAFTGAELTLFDPNPEKGIWHQGESFLSNEKDLPQEFDRAIEVSGSIQALQLCLDQVLREGQITTGSWYGDQNQILNLGGSFHWKRLSLVSSQVSHISPHLGVSWTKERRMNLVLNLLKTIETEDLLTHRFPLSQGKEAYELLTSGAFQGLIALIPWE